jgi:hypothetical protein
VTRKCSTSRDAWQKKIDRLKKTDPQVLAARVNRKVKAWKRKQAKAAKSTDAQMMGDFDNDYLPPDPGDGHPCQPDWVAYVLATAIRDAAAAAYYACMAANEGGGGGGGYYA